MHKILIYCSVIDSPTDEIFKYPFHVFFHSLTLYKCEANLRHQPQSMRALKNNELISNNVLKCSPNNPAKVREGTIVFFTADISAKLIANPIKFSLKHKFIQK